MSDWGSVYIHLNKIKKEYQSFSVTNMSITQHKEQRNEQIKTVMNIIQIRILTSWCQGNILFPNSIFYLNLMHGVDLILGY